jgi:RnfABCDGE-type electron transport complex B subunit
VNAILIAAIVLAAIGIVVGIALVFIGTKFHVEVDPRETAVREVLPGNNCGACGYAGCDAVASAIVVGDAPASACPVGGSAVTEKINEIMGTHAEAAARKVASIRCNGTCENTSTKNNYVGIRDCRAVALSALYPRDCDYGCLGLGSCAAACPHGAISIQDKGKDVKLVCEVGCIGCRLCTKQCESGAITVEDNLAHIDYTLCEDCGKCAEKCPQKTIS